MSEKNTQAEAPSEREAFEAEMLSRGHDITRKADGFGPYNDFTMQMFWNIWQARAALATQQAGQGEAVAWRCFHCDEVFSTEADAELHFGRSEYDKPACQLSVEHIRWMEAQHRRNVDDDSEVLRTVRSLLIEHEDLRRKAEELGYARGLEDAKKHPEDLGLVATPPAPQQPEAQAQQERDREDAENGDTLWLWKNGDHFLAFKHLYPCFSSGGDPMTLGEPFARAEFRASYDRAARSSEGGQP